MPQSTVSRHLAVLRNAGWVTERRRGVWMYYRLNDADPGLQRGLQQSLFAHLARNSQITKDRGTLDRYLQEKENRCEWGKPQ